jgi:RHS repeat-associated protein
MTQVSTGTGSTCTTPTTTATYTYDGTGVRTSKTVGATTTNFLWDPSGRLPMLLREVAGSTATYYIYGPGGIPLEQISGSTFLYYHQDQLGSTRAITDAAGAVKATYTYDAYGSVSACTGTTVTVNGSNICTGTILVSNLLRYAGQYTDAESGLIYLRARYYDPATGQFLSRDPAVATTRQPYAYVVDNPLNGTDPTGLACLMFWDPSQCSNPLTDAISSLTGSHGDPGKQASIIYTHTVVSYGGCFIVCLNGSFQGGVGAVNGGGVGLLARGPSVGWAHLRPQDRCHVAVGGGGAFGPGAQVTLGSNADGQGLHPDDSEIDFFAGAGGWGGGNVTLVSLEPGDNWHWDTGLHAP